MSHNIFPRGGYDLIYYFIDKCNKETSLYLQSLDSIEFVHFSLNLG